MAVNYKFSRGKTKPSKKFQNVSELRDTCYGKWNWRLDVLRLFQLENIESLEKLAWKTIYVFSKIIVSCVKKLLGTNRGYLETYQTPAIEPFSKNS